MRIYKSLTLLYCDLFFLKLFFLSFFNHSTTKHAVVTAILLLAQKMGYFYMDEAVLVTVLFLIAGAVQLVILFTNFEDPYKMVEELLHAILFEFPEQATQKAKKNKKD